MQFLSEQLDNKARFLALFLVWTLCLGMLTLSVQHSCKPMIGMPSLKCSQVTASRDSRGKSSDNGGQPEVKEEGKQQGNKDTNRPNKISERKLEDAGNAPKPEQRTNGRDLIPAVAGVGSAAAAGVGASALTGAGVISTTVTLGGAVIATPVAVAVAAGILVFLAVRSFTRGA